MVAPNPTFVRGQNAKYSVRADVFRFASKLRHCSMRSAPRICAKLRLRARREIGPFFPSVGWAAASPFRAEIVAKVFLGWQTKILSAADAFCARRYE